MLRAAIICAVAIGSGYAVEAQTLIAPQADRAAQSTDAPSPMARDPQMFLEAAKQQLDSIPVSPPDKETRTRLAELREDFTRLAAVYQGGATTEPAAKGAAPTVTAGKPNPGWMSKFYDVERRLASILGLGPDFDTPAVAGTEAVVDAARPAPATGGSAAATANPAAQQSSTAVTPVSGAAVKTIGVKNLDPAIRSQLEQFRTNVELFFDATTGLTDPR